MTNNRDIYSEILKTELFASADPSVLYRVADGGGVSVRDFSRGETVVDGSGKGENTLGIIISGRAEIYSADTARNVLLRVLGRGQIFGLANLFSITDKFPSRITAGTACRVVFITGTAMRQIIENDSSVMYAYIAALSARIRFLNSRIEAFTAGSAERKLALYLVSLAADTGEGGAETLVLPVPMSSLAVALDIGRASLYRAFEKLTADGYICKTGTKLITLSDKAALLAAYK